MSKRITQDKDINEEILRLHRAELNVDNIPIGASIEPYDDGARNSAEANMDILARLVTGRHVCAAICYDGERLLVSNNTGNTEYAQDYMDLLQKFANEPLEGNYADLMSQAYGEAGGIRSWLLKTNQGSRIKTAEEMVGKQGTNSYNFLEALTKKDIREVVRHAEKLLNDSGAPKPIQNLASEVLRPIIETKQMANAIVKGRLDPKVLQAIQMGNIRYIDGSNDIHAEMKIAQNLQEQGKLQQKSEYYIGVSKLACCPCGVGLKQIQQDTGANLRVSGTHGGTYKRWIPPPVLNSTNMLATLKGIKGGEYDKLPDTTPLSADALNIRDPQLTRVARNQLEMYQEYDKLEKTLKPIKILAKEIDALENEELQINRDFSLAKQEMQSLEAQSKRESKENTIKQEQRESLKRATKELEEARQKYNPKGVGRINFELSKKINSLSAKVELLNRNIGPEDHKFINHNVKAIESTKQKIEDLEQNRSLIQGSIEDKKKELYLLQQKTDPEGQLNKQYEQYGNAITEFESFLNKSKDKSKVVKASNSIDLPLDNSWYSEQDIVRTLQSHGNGAQVENPVAYTGQLRSTFNQIQQERRDGNYLIPMNVNVISRDFEHNRNNHWVGMHVVRSGGRITEVNYLDPTGMTISDNMRSLTKSVSGVQVIDHRITLQQGRIMGQGNGRYFEGNDYDCGPLLSYMLAQSAQNNLNEVREAGGIQNIKVSQELGQKLRYSQNSINQIAHSLGGNIPVDQEVISRLLPKKYEKPHHVVAIDQERAQEPQYLENIANIRKMLMENNRLNFNHQNGTPSTPPPSPMNRNINNGKGQKL